MTPRLLLSRKEPVPTGSIGLVCRSCGQVAVYGPEDFSDLVISRDALSWTSVCCRVPQEQPLGPTLAQVEAKKAELIAIFGAWDPAWEGTRPTLREYLAGIGLPGVVV